MCPANREIVPGFHHGNAHQLAVELLCLKTSHAQNDLIAMRVVGVHTLAVYRALAGMPQDRTVALTVNQPIEAISPLVFTIAGHGKARIAELVFGIGHHNIGGSRVVEECIHK